ncbi:MAG: anti-sigma factor domain-containing protein, partial [Panacagrimonas sp.]
AARSQLLDAAAAATSKTAPLRRRPHLRRRSRWMWPYAAGFATAASLVMAFLFGQRNALHADTPPQWLPSGPRIAMPEPVESQLSTVVLGSSEAEAEISTYLAKLSMPASSMGWMISISGDHRRLYAVAAEDFLQVGRFRVQLWGLLPNAEPIHLGALPISREAVASFAIPDRLLGHDQVRFALTLEPGSGELAAQPRGPIMSAATALDSI